ncbi:S1C family serine protease [Actinophytocola xanthii]|uniref:PDZ domain-containing protein n=1 Tax=Actinophytocola xanthii TaxID=1912961 RepID=A0A1Q8CLH9_9PSEU|nr:trypsin-like peptidase domain-containing protein [Actinophytocola xanthii]OLF15199.1 hypothetical protein BU204_23345 [Actinophytocola xanthii]
MTEDNREPKPEEPARPEPAASPAPGEGQLATPPSAPSGDSRPAAEPPPSPAGPPASEPSPSQAAPPAAATPGTTTPYSPPAGASPYQAAGDQTPRRGFGVPGERVLYGTAAPQAGLGGPPPPGGYRYGAPPMGVPGQPRPTGVAEKPRGRAGLVAGLAVLALLVGGGAGAVGGYVVADNESNGAATSALDQPRPAEQTGNAPAGSVEAVAEKVLPSVVQLQVRGRSSAGEGSGFVISSDGLIVTNNHVVEAAAENGQIVAVFHDGSTASAEIVGRDPTSDVAVVRAEKSGLPVSELGRSDDLRVGQGVVAFGSPFELSGTVTSGIVSALQRPTRAGGEDGSQATVMDAIQTDAAINPGNSGGPLVNMQGQVIGINSAIYSPTGGGQAQGGSVGIGFAIPIDQARRTADEIVKTGKATQTILGVTVRDNDAGGALIVDVTANGPGANAGLADGDVVTKLDERRIDTSDALVAAVRSHKPGDKVRLELDNGSRTVEATLAGQPVETE